MSFSENLVELRKQANMSQDQLAERLNITRQAVSKWESGLSTPDLDTVIRLAGVFNVSTDRLLKGNDDKGKYISSHKTDIYTIMTFVFIMSVFLFGMLLAIANRISSHPDGGIWHFSLLTMLAATILFICILIGHKIKNRKKNKA